NILCDIPLLRCGWCGITLRIACGIYFYVIDETVLEFQFPLQVEFDGLHVSLGFMYSKVKKLCFTGLQPCPHRNELITGRIMIFMCHPAHWRMNKIVIFVRYETSF